MSLKQWFLSILTIALCFAVISAAGYAFSIGENELLSVKTDQTPNLDGTGEGLWNKAPALEIPVSGGRSGPTTVKIKSMHTDTQVYFLAEWEDSEETLDRMPIEFDGEKWKQLPGGGAHYEDKFSVYWSINDSVKGFNEKGCMVTCHGEEGATKYGAHRTSAPDERVDQWHWKGSRTNPADYIDDQYVDWRKKGEVNDKGKPAKEAGRNADPKTGGGYIDNFDKENKQPVYMFKDPAHPLISKSFIMKEEAVPFVNHGQFKKGDRIPGHVVEPVMGDEADIPGKGVWKDGKWTLEWGRKLATGSKYDVDFSNLAKEYPFGVATFNAEQWDHSYNLGAYKLVFQQ